MRKTRVFIFLILASTVGVILAQNRSISAPVNGGPQNQSTVSSPLFNQGTLPPPGNMSSLGPNNVSNGAAFNSAGNNEELNEANEEGNEVNQETSGISQETNGISARNNSAF